MKSKEEHFFVIGRLELALPPISLSVNEAINIATRVEGLQHT
jgi:hypothetical protein